MIANLKALKKGIKEVQCMHANITTFRTEVKTWLANQKVHIACLQETHLPEEKLQEVATSLAGMGYQTWCEAAAKTEHGTSGGLMCAAKRHLNFRYHGSMTVAGKGCQILLEGLLAEMWLWGTSTWNRARDRQVKSTRAYCPGWRASSGPAMCLDDHG